MISAPRFLYWGVPKNETMYFLDCVSERTQDWKYSKVVVCTLSDYLS